MVDRLATSLSATILATLFTLAPVASADSSADIREAIESARSETSCESLQYNSIVEKAAEVFNRLTDDYLDHTATRVQNKDTNPGAIPDPLPGLKDLGYPGTKAFLIQGTHQTAALAIKAAVLQGDAFNKFSDCSYSDFGADLRRNDRTGYYLAAVVLAAA